MQRPGAAQAPGDARMNPARIYVLQVEREIRDAARERHRPRGAQCARGRAVDERAEHGTLERELAARATAVAARVRGAAIDVDRARKVVGVVGNRSLERSGTGRAREVIDVRDHESGPGERELEAHRIREVERAIGRRRERRAQLLMDPEQRVVAVERYVAGRGRAEQGTGPVDVGRERDPVVEADVGVRAERHRSQGALPARDREMPAEIRAGEASLAELEHAALDVYAET